MNKDSDRDKLYKEGIPLKEVYADYSSLSLPKWVLENIDNARIYGNQRKCVILQDGRKYHLNNKLNDLTGAEWTAFINSVFKTHYATKGKEGYAYSIRKIHPSPKPPQLMRDLILFFTKENELVLDCFAGVGGTLIGSALCNRDAIGIELNKEYIEAYKAATAELELKEFPVICGDSLQVLRENNEFKEILKNKKISLLLIDPPYSNMMSKKKTGADVSIYGKKSTPFTTLNCDLGNMNRKDFLESLKKAVLLSLQYMKVEGYVVVFIKDLQPKKKETNLLHAEVVNKLNEIPELYYKGMKIWTDGTAKLFPYGYPFSFVANQTHQYILVFRKEKR